MTKTRYNGMAELRDKLISKVLGETEQPTNNEQLDAVVINQVKCKVLKDELDHPTLDAADLVDVKAKYKAFLLS